MTTFSDIFKDGLESAIELRVLKETSEIERERSEGRSEFGNPQTVTQPVRQSQLPGGQPLNFISNNQTLLILGFSGLLFLGLLLLFLQRR